MYKVTFEKTMNETKILSGKSNSIATSIGKIASIHEPLLLDRSVCLPLYAMWPSFGYFSAVI